MRIFFVMVLFIITNTRLCNAADPSPTNDAPIVGEQNAVVEINATSTPNEKSTSSPNTVYKWVDDKGLTHYGDKPPSENMTPMTLPDIQILESVDVEKQETSTQEVTPAPSGNSSNYRLGISAPKNNETIMQNQDGTVAIALSINTPLLENHHILMNVDGSEISTDNAGAVNLPLDQGNHDVQAFIMDDAQNELASSDRVSFRVVGHNQRFNQSVRHTAFPIPGVTAVPATSVPTITPVMAAPSDTKPTKAPKPPKEPKITPKPDPYISG